MKKYKISEMVYEKMCEFLKSMHNIKQDSYRSQNDRKFAEEICNKISPYIYDSEIVSEEKAWMPEYPEVGK